MSQPLFSIVIAVLNRADTLHRCIDSIVAQRYPHKEIIIMDGGSTDGVVDILKNRTDDITYWESASDRSITHAWNKALKHISGDWVYFMGADDWLYGDDVLSDVAEHLVSGDQSALVVYGRMAHVSESGKTIQYHGTEWPGFQNFQFFETKVPHQGAFQHKTVFDIYGPFDESYRIAADLELLTRSFKDKAPRFIEELIVANHQRGGLAEDPANSYQTLRESMRAQKQHGISIAPVLWPLTKALMKKAFSAAFGNRNCKKAVDIARMVSGRCRLWE